MTEHHEEDEDVYTPQPMQVPPNCDPEVSKAFLRRMYSPVDPLLEYMLKTLRDAIREEYPVETADSFE